MSIAAVSASFVAATRESAGPAALEGATAAQAGARKPREGGRRHELVDAMTGVLGLDAEQSKGQEQAVFRFAHALMHDLRSVDAGTASAGRGHAWGRRDWSDLPQRIDALATAAGAGSSAAAQAAQVGAAVAPDPSQDAAMPATVGAPELELPIQPNPLTATSAAVHLMQVPTSRLLEAYVALHEALGKQAPADGSDAAARSQLASFLGKLSDQLAPDAASALPAGSVLHLTA